MGLVRRLSLTHLACAVLGLWLCAVGAEAQDAKARARTLFNEGVAQYEAQHYREALSAFEQAYRMAPHPAVRVNMANCFEQLGQYAEAVFNFQRFLEESGSEVDPNRRAEVELAIARLTPHIGTLVVEVDPIDASYTIDGAIPKRSPTGAVQLPEGRHIVRATRSGYEPAERSVDVEGGAERRVNILLAREMPAGAVAEAAPSAFQAHDDELTGSSAPIEKDEPSGGSTLRPWMWSSLGAAVVFGIGSGVTGGLALKAQSQFNDDVTKSNDPTRTPNERRQAHDDGLTAADRADRYALLCDVLGAVAGVAAVTSLVLWRLDKRSHKASESHVQVAPMLRQASGGGLLVQGGF